MTEEIVTDIAGHISGGAGPEGDGFRLHTWLLRFGSASYERQATVDYWVFPGLAGGWAPLWAAYHTFIIWRLIVLDK